MRPDASDLVGGPDRRADRVAARCRVVIAPVLRADPVQVVEIGGSSDQLHVIPASNWAPAWDGAFPPADAACVVIFDHYRDVWLTAWDQVS